MIKPYIKRALQLFAARFGRHNRTPKQAELLLLMYHRILPADDPRASLEEPGMMVTPETFRLHLLTIKQLFEPVHLSHWLSLKAMGHKPPLRSCAITFDDGWADNYEFAYPILRELNIPATIYLVADMIGNKQSFWPERLANLISSISCDHSEQWSQPCLEWIKQSTTSYTFGNKVPSQEQLSEIIGACKTLSDTEVHKRLDAIENTLNISPQSNQPSLLNWQQVNEMCEDGLIEMGSHTCHHIRLGSDKNDALLAHEIIDSKKKIHKHTNKAVTTFCYPNGDYSQAALNLVEKNYSGAVTTKPGWNTMTSNNHLLKRIGIHEDIAYDRTSFLARISGWL